MAVSEIKKYSLIGLESEKSALIELLHSLGVVQVIESESALKNASSGEESAEYKFAQVSFAIKFLSEYDETKVPLKDKITGNKIHITKMKMDEILSSFDYMSVVERCVELEEKVNSYGSVIERNLAEIELLKPWAKLNTSLKGSIETENTQTLLGVIEAASVGDFIGKFGSKRLAAVDIVSQDQTNAYVCLSYHKKAKDNIKTVISEFDFKIEQFPENNQIPSSRIKHLQDELKNAEKELQITKQYIKELTPHLHNLKIVLDELNWQVEENSVAMLSTGTKKTFCLKFWAPIGLEKKIIETINKKTSKAIIERLPIDPDESVPVALRNSEGIYPFEMVTGIYGMPLSSEPDPTPYLAGFFTIFFGMALTDAGYGLVLASLSYLAIKIFKIPKESSKLFRVLIWGGISTFVLGALFGGWFGINIDEQLPAAISGPLQAIRIIDPVKNPITILIVTLIMGIIQVMVGLAISLYWKAKCGKLKSGILDDGTWLYFITMLMLWICTKTGVLSANLSFAALYLVYSGVLLLIVTQGRNEKSIVMKAFKGVGSLYGLVGYFSDVLSYSRLLALGLATGIIAMVINMIGLMAADMIPYVGWVIAIVIFIGGHIFNMVINVLGAFIHSARLQFVEFFAKFMEGGGVRFKPFAKKTKYTRIISNN